MYEGMAVFFFLATGAVSLFTFCGVAVWANARRQERVALYRTELLKKLAEQPSEGARQVLAMMRDESARKDVARRRGVLLGGLITCALGIGLVGLLSSIPTSGIDLREVGLIPFMIGLVLVLFAVFGLRPRQAELPAAASPAAPAEPTPSTHEAA